MVDTKIEDLTREERSLVGALYARRQSVTAAVLRDEVGVEDVAFHVESLIEGSDPFVYRGKEELASGELAWTYALSPHGREVASETFSDAPIYLVHDLREQLSKQQSRINYLEKTLQKQKKMLAAQGKQTKTCLKKTSKLEQKLKEKEEQLENKIEKKTMSIYGIHKNLHNMSVRIDQLEESLSESDSSDDDTE